MDPESGFYEDEPVFEETQDFDENIDGVIEFKKETARGSGEGGWNPEMWSLEYYRYLFDIDTTEVGWRIILPFLPFTRLFHNHITQNGGTPDVYGPFWICTTIGLLSPVFLSISVMVQNYGSDEVGSISWSHDFLKMILVLFMSYMYGLFYPCILGVIFKYNLKVQQISLRSMCCYFGYSLVVLGVALVICIVPNEFLRTVSVVVAIVVSCLFIGLNFWLPEMGDIKPIFHLFLIPILIFHGIFFFLMKIFVFNYTQWEQ